MPESTESEQLLNDPGETSENAEPQCGSLRSCSDSVLSHYQRKKGRDLYDLWRAASSIHIEDRDVLDCFERYMHHSRARVSRAEFEENLLAKLADKVFVEDVALLLKEPESYTASIAGDLVLTRFVAKLPGQAWKRPPLAPG